MSAVRNHPADRRTLRLLAQELTDNDVAKLRVFLRLGQDRLEREWEIVHEGEAHVLVYGGDEPCTLQGVTNDPLEVRRVSDPVHTLRAGLRVATLVRPLQYEVVIDTLRDAERKAASTAPPAPPAPPLPTPQPAALPMLAAGARYRLRRWPAAEWVQRNRAHLRVANFLSTGYVDAAELIRLANVSDADCHEALATLFAAGALDVQPAPGTEPPVAPTAPAPAPAPRRSAAAGLLDRIRRKLGAGTPP